MAELDFSFDMQGIDRGALLAAAAGDLQALNARLSAGERTPQPTPEADLVSELQRDVAEFAGFPDVRRIVDGDFLARNRPAPEVFEQLAQDFNFYSLRFPVALFPRR